jgi:hypothetical protein
VCDAKIQYASLMASLQVEEKKRDGILEEQRIHQADLESKTQALLKLVETNQTLLQQQEGLEKEAKAERVEQQEGFSQQQRAVMQEINEVERRIAVLLDQVHKLSQSEDLALSSDPHTRQVVASAERLKNLETETKEMLVQAEAQRKEAKRLNVVISKKAKADQLASEAKFKAIEKLTLSVGEWDSKIKQLQEERQRLDGELKAAEAADALEAQRPSFFLTS